MAKKYRVLPSEEERAWLHALVGRRTHTEDVLAVYTRPYDPRCPQVCLDETSRQLLARPIPRVHTRAAGRGPSPAPGGECADPPGVVRYGDATSYRAGPVGAGAQGEKE